MPRCDGGVAIAAEMAVAGQRDTGTHPRHTDGAVIVHRPVEVAFDADTVSGMLCCSPLQGGDFAGMCQQVTYLGGQ